MWLIYIEGFFAVLTSDVISNFSFFFRFYQNLHIEKILLGAYGGQFLVKKKKLGPKMDVSDHFKSGGVLGYFLRPLVQNILVLVRFHN